MTPRVSVVVPTFRRPALLDRCLTALLAQDLPAHEYEVVVADDEASPVTRRQVCASASRSRVPVIYVPVLERHGPAAARNAGWRAARGEIIAFTDDDCVPAPDWLRAGMQCFGNGLAAAWGRIVIPLPARPTDYEKDAARMQFAGFTTANCFLRREAIAAVGGFDERFTAAWREDSDLEFALLERRFEIGHAEAAVVLHPVRPAQWGVSLRQQRKSMFNALLYKKHPELYRTRIQRAPPGRYYAIVLSLMAAATGLIAGAPVLAVPALAVWTALTAAFCARRLARTSRAPGHVADVVFTSLLIPPLSVYWRLRGALRFRVPFL